MPVTDRIMRIIHVEGQGLVASDSFGRVHVFDDDLQLTRSSAHVRDARPLYGLAVSDGWVIGKDRMGAILRWSLDTLDLVNRLDPATNADTSTLIEGEEPSPASSRGIGVWNGRIYVTSGFHHQMLVINLETFEIEQIVDNPCNSPVEWFSTEHPTHHAISDKAGVVRFGNLDQVDFPEQLDLECGNIHRVVYDSHHDRFWCTQDDGYGDVGDISNGVLIISPEGKKIGEHLWARDDVEFLAFSPDYRRVYSGGFDSELVIYDNSDSQPRVERTVSGFPHQLSDLTVSATGELYVLSQDGEITKLDADGTFQKRLGFRRQAVWDIQQSLEDPNVLYCATDSGASVYQVTHTATGPSLQLATTVDTGRGFTRRLVPVPGGWIGITRDGHALRVTTDGATHWDVHLQAGLLHTVAVNPDGTRALVASNTGAIEIDTTTGERLENLTIEGIPIWASTYLPNGDRVIGDREGALAAFRPHETTPYWTMEDLGYPKRLWVENETLYFVGDGGLKEIEVGVGVGKVFVDLLSNTPENATIADGIVAVSSYGMQVVGYNYDDGELVAFLEDLPDYPKAVATVRSQTGEPYLLVGCRTGLLSMYRRDKSAENGTFSKYQDTWVARQAARFELNYRNGEEPTNV